MKWTLVLMVFLGFSQISHGRDTSGCTPLIEQTANAQITSL
ncbi:MAG: hypothetical protein ACPGJV_00100 [Bacteriovoracaceae bacterium]